ncbi:MAG: leucyl/phenylalanyl-tRNA--protein transferase [Ideonella sp. WA131b]|jgi:leucyl/phenylalanyl-tRNA--protein transferase|nr:leucyl/phenylalanyl-tRNA--protein transferase [Ideonella sp. WA131b]
MSLLHWIDDGQPLPNASLALGPGTEAPGLVAAGGRVTPDRLLEAYRAGIFPWYSPGQPVLWWSPDPRMVLPVAEFRLSPSLKKTIRRFLRTPGCEVRVDLDLAAVIGACAGTPREGQEGTWIVPAMRDAYVAWGAMGQVHSVETWVQGRLVGGLYFVLLGRMAYGESMFSHATDASKIALAALVAGCRRRGIAWIDCQQNTRHLASLGAREVPRERFLEHVWRASREQGPAAWTYDPDDWALLLEPPVTPLPSPA